MLLQEQQAAQVVKDPVGTLSQTVTVLTGLLSPDGEREGVNAAALEENPVAH